MLIVLTPDETAEYAQKGRLRGSRAGWDAAEMIVDASGNILKSKFVEGDARPSMHQFTGDGPNAKGADNCQICGRWIGEIETDICRDRLAPAPAAEPTIKALEWKKSALLTMWQKQLIVRVTDTVLGRFSDCQAEATVSGPLPPAWMGPDGVHHEVADVEAGMAAVEAHYERVIRSALAHPAPTPVSAPEDFEKDQARVWVKRVLAAQARLNAAVSALPATSPTKTEESGKNRTVVAFEAGRRSGLGEAAAMLDEDAQEYNRIRDPGMANHCRARAKRIRVLASKAKEGE